MDGFEALRTERSIEHYRNTSHVLAGVALRGYGLKLSDETIDNWDDTTTLMCYIDTVLDSNVDSDIKEEALGYLMAAFVGEPENMPAAPSPWAEEAGRAATALRSQTSESELHRFISKGGTATIVSEKSKHTDNLREYAKLIRLEGQLAADMLLAVVHAQDRAHPSYDRFAWCVKRLGNPSST